nr:hypothetical protein [Tanacetum cinerariifolium]
MAAYQLRSFEGVFTVGCFANRLNDEDASSAVSVGVLDEASSSTGSLGLIFQQQPLQACTSIQNEAGESTPTLTADEASSSFKRLAKHPTVKTPSKPNEEKKKRGKYRLEVVADDTASTIVVMFNDTTTELIKCSAKSLMVGDDEGADVDSDSNLPTTIRNLVVLCLQTVTFHCMVMVENFRNKKGGTTYPAVMKSAEKVLPDNLGNGSVKHVTVHRGKDVKSIGVLSIKVGKIRISRVGNEPSTPGYIPLKAHREGGQCTKCLGKGFNSPSWKRREKYWRPIHQGGKNKDFKSW